MKTLKEILNQSKINHVAIPAFNIDSFEIYQAIELVVKEINKPCLVQLSEGEDKFIEAERLFVLVKKAQIDGLPIYLNMDHGQDTNRLKFLAKLGFDMIHFDGSKLDYPTNLLETTNFVNYIKTNSPHCLVEAEFNKINLVDSQVADISYTNPSQALEFINQTHADLLAVSIGNMHGVSQNLPEKLNFDILGQIQSLLPDQFFTLHGGSGINSQEINSAIKYGIVKININTDLRLQFFKSIRHQLEDKSVDKIYPIFTEVINDLQKIIKQKFLCMM